jgi:hypothetical protein
MAGKLVHIIDNLRTVLGLINDVLFSTMVIYFFQTVFFKAEIGIITPLVMLAVFAISEVCAEKCTNIFFLCIPQLIVCVLLGFIPVDAGSRTVLCAAAFVKMASSVSYVKNGMKPRKIDEAPWITVLVALVIYGFGYFLKIDGLNISAYVLLLLMLILFFVRLYLQGLNGYVSSAKEAKGLPLSRIVSVNNVMIAGILAFFLVLTALSGLFDFDFTGKYILSGIKYVVLGIIYGIDKLVKFLIRLVAKDGDITVEYGQADVTYEAMSDNFEILDDILGVAVELFILVGCIYLAYLFIRRLVKNFMVKHLVTADVVESADRDEVKDIRIKRKVREKQAASLNVRLRKTYRQGVKRYGDEINLKSTDTCGDIEEKISKQNADISTATKLYEQVRYGEVQADRKMLREMDNAFGRR